jgi:hypothetical protein
MTKIIEVKEAIDDTKSDFNIKRFNVGKLRSEGPIKTIDARGINKKKFEETCSNYKNIIFEMPKSLDHKAIIDVLNGKGSFVKDFFGYSEWINDYDNVISPTFTFNPYNVYNKIEEMSGFFKYYYNFSKTFSFIPNVKIFESVYEINLDGRKKRKLDKQIISFDDYIRFVDEVYHILDEKNNKPIFVPFSLKFSMVEIEQLIKNYISKGYTHIWIDFESAKTVEWGIISKLMQVYSILRKSERFDETIFFITNIKKEITNFKWWEFRWR